MTYTNELPPGAVIAPMELPWLRAVVYAGDADAGEPLLDQDIEITLPYKLRPEFGFAGMTVPFISLLHFLRENGTPVSRNRDLTLRHEARTEWMIEEGILYDRQMHAVLPPQALDNEGVACFSFDTNYVLGVLADDVAEADPDRAARLRHIADTYFPEKDRDDPTEEELQRASGVIGEMIATHEQVLEDGGEATVMCHAGVK
jgi:hypothetical protein